MGNRGRICRLCSQKCVQNFKNIEGNVKEAVEILLPKINLSVSDAPVMCTNCAKTLEKCSDFKWTCLSRHRSMVSCVNSKGNVKRSLKYLHLIKEDNRNTNTILQHNRCGLCTNPSNSCSFLSPNVEEAKMMLRECFPELVLSIIKICAPCYESLVSCFHFITKCSIVEEKIQKYGGNSSISDDGIRELNHPSRVPIQLEQIFCNDGTNSDEEVAHRDKIIVKMVDQNCHYSEQFMSEDMSSCQEGYNTVDVIKEESKFLEETENNVKQKCENFVKKEDQDVNDKLQFTPKNLLVLEEESKKLDMVKMEATIFEKERNEVVYESENFVEMEEQKLKNLQFTSKIPSMMIYHNQIGVIKPDKTLNEAREAANDMIELKHEAYLEVENQKFNSLPHFTSNNVLTCEEDCTKFDVSKIEEICSKKGENGAESENKYLATMEEPKYDLNEEVDIKPDLQNSDRFDNGVVSSHLEVASWLLRNRECLLSNLEGNLSESSIKHTLTKEHVSKVRIQQCDSCSYQTKYKVNLKRHLLVHKDPSKVKMYKCDSCSYQTNYSNNLKKHLLVHKDPSEVTMYKCDLCSYQTKRGFCLKTHSLVHKDPSEVKMHKCDSCSYQTKRVSCLKTHLLVHKDPSEIKMHKCVSCSYQTSYKESLKIHLLVHKDPSEVTMYKCDSCSYQTKRAFCLKTHSLVHKDPSEIKMHKCDSCSYQTKHKFDLKGHLLIHAPEAEMYKCDSCSYQTNYKRNLKIHVLVHKDPSKVRMYQCDSCSYQTKRKGDLKHHILRLHKDSSEIM